MIEIDQRIDRGIFGRRNGGPTFNKELLESSSPPLHTNLYDTFELSTIDDEEEKDELLSLQLNTYHAGYISKDGLDEPEQSIEVRLDFDPKISEDLGIPSSSHTSPSIYTMKTYTTEEQEQQQQQQQQQEMKQQPQDETLQTTRTTLPSHSNPSKTIVDLTLPNSFRERNLELNPHNTYLSKKYNSERIESILDTLCPLDDTRSPDEMQGLNTCTITLPVEMISPDISSLGGNSMKLDDGILNQTLLKQTRPTNSPKGVMDLDQSTSVDSIKCANPKIARLKHRLRELEQEFRLSQKLTSFAYVPEDDMNAYC